MVLLAVPGQAVPDLLSAQGPALAGKIVIDAVNRMGEPETDSRALIAADPDARAVAEELITAVGLDPACIGDASATGTVDGLLPLWFALVKQHGGNRKVALRVVTEG